MLLTVAIPCFNEASVLAQTVAQLRDYLESADWKAGQTGGWEILLVDDGSTDNSREILAELAAADPRVRYVSYRMNGGQGKALQTAFAHSRGEWIFCVDADLDYGPDHIKDFMDAAREGGADIVVGSAYMKGGSNSGVPRMRYLMSRAMNLYYQRVLKIGLATYTSILRLYRRDVINSIMLTSNDKDILPEILFKASLLGIPMLEAPAHLKWQERIATSGRSGASVISTAAKAARHLSWGALENPLLFFLLPAAAVGIGTLWFATALLTLFVDAYAQVNSAGLAAITNAAHSVMVENPQTIIIFAVLLQAALVLFAVGMVTLQNKVKKEHDFIYATKLLARFEHRTPRPQPEENGSRENI